MEGHIKIPANLLIRNNNKRVIDAVEGVLEEVKNGSVFIKKTKVSETIISLLHQHILDDNQWLNVSIDVAKKILMYMPAKDCWRFARRFNHTFKLWVESVIDLYELKLQEWCDRNSKYIAGRIEILYFCEYKTKKQNFITFKKDLRYFTIEKFEHDKIGISIYVNGISICYIDHIKNREMRENVGACIRLGINTTWKHYPQVSQYYYGPGLKCRDYFASLIFPLKK